MHVHADVIGYQTVILIVYYHIIKNDIQYSLVTYCVNKVLHILYTTNDTNLCFTGEHL